MVYQSMRLTSRLAVFTFLYRPLELLTDFVPDNMLLITGGYLIILFYYVQVVRTGQTPVNGVIIVME